MDKIKYFGLFFLFVVFVFCHGSKVNADCEYNSVSGSIEHEETIVLFNSPTDYSFVKLDYGVFVFQNYQVSWIVRDEGNILCAGIDDDYPWNEESMIDVRKVIYIGGNQFYMVLCWRT